MVLRKNTHNIVASSFGMESALTSATIWVSGREAPLRVHGFGDMAQHCQRATVVVIAEAIQWSPFSGSSLRSPMAGRPLLHIAGVMSMLLYRAGPVGRFRVQHLQLGIGGMKRHNNATNFRHTRLVQQTRNYKPLVTLVNQIARELLPKWFTCTTMQLSCNVLTKPHEHLHDSSPGWAAFSTGQHTRGPYGWW